jgi:5-methylcytosine-specific restriction endonuclease McrA
MPYKNKEEQTAYHKAYYLANKEKRAAYRLENKEKLTAQTKAWQLANPEKVIASRSAWSKNNQEKRIKSHKAYLLRLNLINKNISKRTLSAWALQVKERDCYTCRDCGATDKLHAHHIWPKISHPEHALDVVNGTTLCEACHIYEHQTNGT